MLPAHLHSCRYYRRRRCRRHRHRRRRCCHRRLHPRPRFRNRHHFLLTG